MAGARVFAQSILQFVSSGQLEQNMNTAPRSRFTFFTGGAPRASGLARQGPEYANSHLRPASLQNVISASRRRNRSFVFSRPAQRLTMSLLGSLPFTWQ